LKLWGAASGALIRSFAPPVLGLPRG
jgi:hypothetical protein